MTEIRWSNGFYEIDSEGVPCARILPAEGAEDCFVPLEDGAWKWIRHTAAPVDHMRMEMLLYGPPDFTMVPAVSYNGNGWGDMPEYVGDRDEDGTPWSFASHRTTIPSCTYSENERISLALMSEANDNCACSLYKTAEGELHAVIFPEEEKPRTLQRHFWKEAFQGTMDPRQEFTAILQAVPADGGRHRYHHLLDFAWRYYGHPMKAPRSAEEIYKLGMAYTFFLFEREKDGFAGFVDGSQWHISITGYKKREHCYELGWVGQSASMANACIYEYLRSGKKLYLDMAMEAHDAWLKFGLRKKGLLVSQMNRHPLRYLSYDKDMAVDPWDWGEAHYEDILNRIGKDLKRDPDGGVTIRNDACDLGTGAEGYFEAYELLKEAGIDKPEYLQVALDVCEFALENQAEDGSFAKSWDYKGNLIAKDGTIGCCLVLPLLSGYVKTGDRRYLESAERSFDFYYQELLEKGFTTAGALDTYSIDKESAVLLLRDALRLYDVTRKAEYVEASEKIAWYICTWMMHFTIHYPEDCMISEIGFDTFGSTSVSTPHQALDHYALRAVLPFLELYEITGKRQWKERAQAFWCNACQGISDGTLIVNGRIRPAGGQDEAVFHTRWGRRTSAAFSLSQWLPAWPCAYRLENLRWHPDWEVFDEGLTCIEGSLK